MSKEYYRNPRMFGERAFKCPNCNKMLALKATGSMFEIEFRCSRCKALVYVKCNEAIPMKMGIEGDILKIKAFIKIILQSIIDSVNLSKKELKVIKEKIESIINML